MSLKEQWLAPGVVKEIVKWLVIAGIVAAVALGLVNREWISGVVSDVAGWIGTLRKAAE